MVWEEPHHHLILYPSNLSFQFQLRLSYLLNLILKVLARLENLQSLLSVIVDTDSAISLIGLDLTKKVSNLTWNEKYTGSNIEMVNEEALKIVDAIKVKIEIEDEKYNIPMIVVEDFPYCCLIGNDRMDRKVKIDLINHQIKKGNNKINLLNTSDIKKFTDLTENVELADFVKLELNVKENFQKIFL